ncbi:NYN domain-containing protein [Tuberibacillus sp. Marseille-P3662]|uniref:NYN domain-containing protein n=1 Tax=Tuberibacillus sp. Marseille-P3662 TaxID=1965358 RepID=UPI000A1CC6CA|nr:NYN domain-containing protein [Tuberibacillus sp. Marseille-P3662]
MDVLLVDGYNVIGAWPELNQMRKIDFANARDLLIDKLAEYQAYKGWRVMAIFDAHLVPGMEAKTKHANVEVIYTREKETADECIERLVSKIKNVRTRVHVATSDYTEQWTVFSQGALRKSSRELHREILKIEQQISTKVTETNQQKKASRIQFNEDLTKLFEKWRRSD